ncbi:polynucleotide kinase-phosphatase [Dictyobacter kobayashii]|uniref:Polynucleotide kinase-phosphatase n=1 Tax=Dictyobacter kobayashii TaxID=2014872 RepID=A0A402ANZ1_9CHLR|nr:polynucleotide kinase-phosphatase [Dictyobacter kobayashii]GCE20690.1 polynucleotide kinase-phosphatase [Dictyobacter kobayashii]
MKITIPEFSLVVLIGPSGSGKSTFARTHFKPTEVISSDYCRGLVADDENDQSATPDAFEVLHFIAAKRLAAGRLTVIDATNVQPEARKALMALAREYHCLVSAIVFNVPESLCHERNHGRADRQFGPHVIRMQAAQMRKSLGRLKTEGFRHIVTLSSPQQIAEVEIERQPLWNNLKHEHGPFDIIGDVHGCFDELQVLLQQLGYVVEKQGEQEPQFQVTHPAGRKVIFLGDLVDRGPATPAVLRLAMDMVASGNAFCVPGNHDVKLLRKLKGNDVSLKHGIVETLQQLEQESPAFKQRIETFVDGLISHYVLDDGKLVVAHAGLPAPMQGRGSRAVREFALYGETTGETDEFGLPIRYNWASDYQGKAMVVYGHTPVPEPTWLNHTINIDTGCVFGGRLTALQYPENQLVSVAAQRTYCDPVRPLQPVVEPVLSIQQQHDELLDVQDYTGKRLVETRLQGKVTIREENAIAALEVMSRFAANPKWLIYLPPTMSPSETSKQPGFLEYPEEAFAYYRKQGVARVVCEEKHMGSRAIVVVCRDEQVAQKRFGVINEGIGICYTRTGRRFFDDAQLEAALLQRVQEALAASGFWERFETDWVCLDCELLPWSVKAQSLVLKQYAAVGAASRGALGQAISVLEQARQHGVEVAALLDTYQQRQRLAERYVNAYRQYCWPVNSLDDLKLAPFHILATEGTVHIDKDHVWHMETLAEICRADERLLLATPFLVVDVNEPASVEKGISWWTELTSHGGEGMVVKPFEFIASGPRGALQPAVKCRGSEYLRIIYGLEYDVPENLNRLRSRGLGAKRSLAMREFALGIESLERFVHNEPLRRVHECVFGVIALESEPVDPRL